MIIFYSSNKNSSFFLSLLALAFAIILFIKAVTEKKTAIIHNCIITEKNCIFYNVI